MIGCLLTKELLLFIIVYLGNLNTYRQKIITVTVSVADFLALTSTVVYFDHLPQ